MSAPTDKPRVVAIVQARLSSSRLPRKVLLDIAGNPMLDRVIARLRRATLIDEVVVATSVASDDDELVAFCEQRQVRVVRGSLDDVLDRFVAAAHQSNAELVVRVTSDCPLVDPDVVDDCIRMYLDGDFDYVANRLPDDRTFPIGLDAEVFSAMSLVAIAQTAIEPYQRQHVTPAFYDGSTDARVGHLRSDLAAGDYRWTVDTADDLRFVRSIFESLPDDAPWKEIKNHVDAHPELRDINRHVAHKHYTDTT